MSRLENFRSLGKHAWYGNLFKKLRKIDLDFCEVFIEQTDHLDVSGYVRRVQGISEQLKSNKNGPLIEELLFVSKEKV